MARFRRRPKLGVFGHLCKLWGKNKPTRVWLVSDSARPCATLRPPPPVSGGSMRWMERWYERPDAVSIFHNSFGRSPAQPEEACLCRGRGRGAAGAGALGLSREAPPARRARSMTPGDIQNGRVGPDPTAGSKTVTGAPRARNTDLRPRNLRKTYQTETTAPC